MYEKHNPCEKGRESPRFKAGSGLNHIHVWDKGEHKNELNTRGCAKRTPILLIIVILAGPCTRYHSWALAPWRWALAPTLALANLALALHQLLHQLPFPCSPTASGQVYGGSAQDPRQVLKCSRTNGGKCSGPTASPEHFPLEIYISYELMQGLEELM